MIKFIQDLFLSAGIILKKVRPENNTWLTSRGINTIIDVGANTGQFAERFSKILPDAKVISFEPIKGVYDELVKNTANLNVKTYNCALGDKDEAVEINISKHSPSSSLLEMANLHTKVFAGTEFEKKERITVKTLDGIALELGNLGKFIVKLDVQGFEDRVILGGKETLKKADLVILETSFQELYVGQMLFNGIYDLLNELGFEFRGNLSQALNPKDGSILYADSVFANTRL
ncbi:MAG: FkbM family methyltransferase [Mucilaginibacter sp.]|uniref:FkbM family methyltransferase n=1 Tax=Mucilaginibacter sp. TaxID=1882438 RepID=UPI00326765B7